MELVPLRNVETHGGPLIVTLTLAAVNDDRRKAFNKIYCGLRDTFVWRGAGSSVPRSMHKLLCIVLRAIPHRLSYCAIQGKMAAPFRMFVRRENPHVLVETL